MSDYWEELQSDRVKQLQEQKEKLQREIKTYQKPDCNRMVAEKLQTTTCGCNCQQMILVLIQYGEAVAWQPYTPTPCHLREVITEETKTHWSQHYLLEKQGEGYYEQFGNYPFDPQYVEGLEWIKNSKRVVETIQINGKYYYKDPCSFADESISESLSSYNCPEFEELLDGIYNMLIEQACYTSSGPDGEEGDGDSDYKLYDSVPLFQFLSLKDDLIAEAQPEAEELASRYIYIQETIQHRRKSKRKDNQEWL